jgi:hypothetical protein
MSFTHVEIEEERTKVGCRTLTLFKGAVFEFVGGFSDHVS